MTDPLLATLPILVCQKCGAQRDLPTSASPTPDVWLSCHCGGTKFSLRMRVPLGKSEPHP